MVFFDVVNGSRVCFSRQLGAVAPSGNWICQGETVRIHKDAGLGEESLAYLSLAAQTESQLAHCAMTKRDGQEEFFRRVDWDCEAGWPCSITGMSVLRDEA